MLKRRIAALARASGFIGGLLGACLLLMGAYYPPGLSDGSANPAGALVSGVYAGADPGGCCWLARDAAWKIAPPKAAATAVVTIFVEPYPPFAHDLQSLQVRAGDGPVANACCYGPGIHQFPVALPPHRNGEVLTMRARAKIAFVPKRLGMNDDDRTLSVLLRGVSFRAADGEAIATTPVAELNARVQLAIYAVVGLIVLVLTRRRPAFGLVALVLLEPLGSETPVWHTTLVPFKAALVGALLGLVMRGGWRGLVRDRRALLLLGSVALLALATLVSMAHATYREPVLREALKAVEYALAFVAAYVALRSDPDLRLARGAFVAVTVLVCVFALAQEMIGAPEGTFAFGRELPRIAGPLEGPNQLAAWLGIVAPVSLAYFAQLRVSGILAVVTEVLTLSRGGAIGMMVAVAVTFARKLRAGWAIALAAVAVVGALALRIGTHRVPGEIDTFNGGLGTRSELWRAAWEMFRAHPLTGVGAGNYELLLGQYGLLGIRTHANSWYFQGAAEGGVVLLLAIALVAAMTIGCFVRSRDPFAIAAFAASAGLCVHQIVDDLVFYPKVGAMWWLLLGVAAASLAVQETADSSTESVPADASRVARMPMGSTH